MHYIVNKYFRRRIAVTRLLSTFHAIHGKLSPLEASSRFVDYVRSDGIVRHLKYDYAVLATGKHQSWPVAPRAYSKAGFLPTPEPN